MYRADSVIREDIRIKFTCFPLRARYFTDYSARRFPRPGGFQKTCVRWLPKIVKRMPGFICLQREQFLQCVFSGDETYVKTRNLKKIMTWKHPSSPLATPSVQKIVPTALWEHRSVHFVDFLGHGDTELLSVIVVHLRGYGSQFVQKGLGWCAMT